MYKFSIRKKHSKRNYRLSDSESDSDDEDTKKNKKISFNDNHIYFHAEVNKARKSRYRNALKKMILLIENKKKTEALKFLPKLNSELMKVAKTGVVKKQNASRNVSRITKKIATI